ncbi:MAG: preprotein translocase subunit SecE [Solirubrobacterales bacterium]
MAKTRAQRKAERRRRAAQQQQAGGGGERAAADESQAQHDTQVPESAGVAEAELAEHGADLEALKGPAPERPEPEAPAPSRADVGRPEEAEAPADKISRRARRRAEREERQRAKESEARRAPREEAPERQRGVVTGFLASCWAELRRVQWPDRETLIQASAITLIFIALMAAYLGVLDAAFNWIVQRIL